MLGSTTASATWYQSVRVLALSYPNYKLTVFVDMKTLSRMTGKDFSGPVPEIRVPTPPVLDAVAAATEAQVSEASTAKKVKRRKSASRDDGVQIVGDVNSFEPNFEPEP